MTAEIWPIASTAPAVSAWMASTRLEMSSVARAVSCASSLTSLATTAKPLPASPARAASIVALRASRLVCSAIPLISLITVAISCEESPSLPTVRVVFSATCTAGTGDPGGLGGVVRDLADRRLHLGGAGGHGVDAGRDLARGGHDPSAWSAAVTGHCAMASAALVSWVEAPPSRAELSLTRVSTPPMASRVWSSASGRLAELGATDLADPHRRSPAAA